MNHLGLTVFSGNTPGLIIDFDQESKEYVVEYTDGRISKTASVYWDFNVPADVDVAAYRQSSKGNGERIVYHPDYGWDVVSFNEEYPDEDEYCDKCGGDGCSACDHTGYHIDKVSKPIDIVDQPSDLGEWVGDYKEDSQQTIEEKLDEVLDTLNDLVEKDEMVHEKMDEETDSAVQSQDHDATEDSYWDRATKPNPMAYDQSFPAGEYTERNPGTLNPKAKVAKDCGCWDGYERVPGTKPCEPGSCEKCDAARKKESAAKKEDASDRMKKVNLVPPSGVRAAAKRGLKYYEEGKAGDGFEAATADRARKIAAGEELTPEHVNRMHSFFERHAGGRSKKAKPGEVTAWDVAWLCWGGDAGRSWAAKKDAELERAAKAPKKKKKESNQYWDPATKNLSIGEDRDENHNWSDIGGNSNVRHAEGEAQKNQHRDQEGNPEVRGVGEDMAFPDSTSEGVVFPDPSVEIATEAQKQNDKKENPNKEVWDKVFSHVREESEAIDEHIASISKFACPDCGDPLVKNICYVCHEDKGKKVKRIAKNKKKMNKIAASLQGRAAELGVLFGEALAGNRTSVTEPSSGLYAIEIHGIDSHPENGGVGNYNRQHGDSPEYLKDVNHGGGGWIDPTPEMFIEGMPRVIEFSTKNESAEDDELIKSLEKFLEEVLGDEFTEKKEETKKEKNSSLKTARPICKVCNQEYVGGSCSLRGTPPQNCPAVNSVEQGGSQMTQPANSQAQTPPMGYTQTNPPSQNSRGYANGIPGALSSVNDGSIVDVVGEPLVEGQTYRLYAGVDGEPEIVRVEESSPTRVLVSRVDSAFPEDAGEPYEITDEQFSVEGMRFSEVDDINPVEVGISATQPTDGTPETNDDAGPGQNDIPGQRDLSTPSKEIGRKSGSEHLAGRHYLPHQQKEFINENGRARNLDKLMLDGTHYVDEVLANSEPDDDFLFGV